MNSTKTVSPCLKPIALALHQNNWQVLAEAVHTIPVVSSLAINVVLNMLQLECQQLCRKDSTCILKRSSPADLHSFNFVALANDLKQKAPLLFAFLEAVGAPDCRRNVRKGVVEETRYPALCTAAAVLLKERCEDMNALQHLLGVVLFDGNASKQVYELVNAIVLVVLFTYCIQAHKRLSRLQLAVSATSTLTKMDQFCHNYDAVVIDWKKQIEQTLSGKCICIINNALRLSHVCIDNQVVALSPCSSVGHIGK